MNTVEQIESAVMRLSPEEYGNLRNWLKDYENEIWDKEMVEDAESGSLDKLAAEASDDLRSGRCTAL